MKNIKRLLVATMALVSMSTMAKVLVPVVPANEDTPVRLNFGLNSGMNGSKDGFGITDMGAGVGFTHLVGYDFEYGIAANGSYATSGYGKKLFSDAGKLTRGPRLDVDVMARYMPEMAERLRAGLVFGVGYGHQFKGAESINENRSFGDLYAKVGPAISYSFTNAVAGYLGIQYSMHNIRIGAKDSIKDYSNHSGLDIPVGLWFGFADSAGLFIEANNRFTNFKNFTKSFREEVSLGVSYAI